MKVALISCFNFEMRTELLKEYFQGQSCEIKVFGADFDHATKTYTADLPDVCAVHVKRYKKNLSFARLSSHTGFAKQMRKELRAYRPDVVYAQAPPNSLIKACARYKKESGCKLIVDLLDMWPESLPVSGFKKLLAAPLLRCWRRRRDKFLRHADLLLVECDLYRQVLRAKKVRLPQTETVYLGKEAYQNPPPDLADDRIDVCYLGSINNIIDIPKIAALLSAVDKHKKVRVHIIGGGENRQTFIDALTTHGIETDYLGKIYDQERKAAVYAKCHFGLNIMKDSVTVGLTIKSLDYFQAGLPLLSNIKGDTRALLKTYGAGFDIDGDLEPLAAQIAALRPEDFLTLRENTRRLFAENLERQKVFDKLKNALDALGEKA